MNDWPVVAVCWAYSSATSASVKFRMVTEADLMLKGLPGLTVAPPFEAVR